jgi:hypothetical protein
MFRRHSCEGRRSPEERRGGGTGVTGKELPGSAAALELLAYEALSYVMHLEQRASERTPASARKPRRT